MDETRQTGPGTQTLPPRDAGAPDVTDPAGGTDAGSVWWTTGTSTLPPAPPPVIPNPPAPATVGPGVPPPRRRRVALGLAALVLLSGAIGGGVGAAFGGGSTTVQTITTASGSTTGSSVSAAASGTVASAASIIEPSVVTITVTNSSGTDTGSGVILRQDGYILTNNHVVSGGGTMSVTLSNGKTYTAQLVGQQAESDLAVVKIGVTGLTAATFAESNSLAVGDLVVAVGSPLGLSNTVTSGIISSLDRTVNTGATATGGASGTAGTIYNAIQTDAPINPGNSGGALVNAKGQVVGITSSIASTGSGSSGFPGQQTTQSGNIGVGFAITSDQAARVGAALIASGTAPEASLGVSAATAGLTAAQQSAGLDDGTGATLGSVTSGSAAAKGGLKAGDVVTAVGGRAITSSDDLVGTIRSYAPGSTVTITYTRGGAQKTAVVTLGTQSASAASSSSSSSGLGGLSGLGQ